ncbi:MAG: 1-acyl-sn-glycerol-3-phosphate acyltransferase, partial [Treponema sp.]|nr:1-acyl-sn-glycerol-3-phosphate acyltransferase [Treponema sp.]
MGKKETVKHYRRHLFLMGLMRISVVPVVRFILRYRCKKEKGPKTPSLVIANHYTDLDPGMIVAGFSGYMYFVASEHAFRWGFVTKLLNFAFSPIPINKAQADSSALREILHRLKAGCSICIFAEGNRSFNGSTGNILPFSTAKLVKMSGADLITYRLEGSYFASPRWSKKMRYGKTRGMVTGKYSAEQLKSMTLEQIFSVIQQGISDDSYKWQKENRIPFRGKDIAEHIETVLYLCPKCRKIG